MAASIKTPSGRQALREMLTVALRAERGAADLAGYLDGDNGTAEVLAQAKAEVDRLIALI